MSLDCTIKARRVKLQFTIRTTLVVTILVAALFGAALIIDRRLAINPDSEKIEIGGQVADLTWNESNWQAEFGSPVADDNHFFSSELPTNQDRVALDQHLLSMDYCNHLGLCSFVASYHIRGFRNASFDRYQFQVLKLELRSDDVATNCRCQYEPENRVLQLELGTWVKSTRTAKLCRLKFVYDGTKFVQQE